MPLEDELSDILKKARNGQQRSMADVARASGLSEVEVSELNGAIATESRTGPGCCPGAWTENGTADTGGGRLDS